MKLGFYSPYLDSLAGGERYVLTLASHWSEVHDVDVFWDDSAICSRAGVRLHLDLSRVRVIKNIFSNANLFSKMQTTKKYDLIFVLSDGSIPLIWSKLGVLHFQRPFIGVGGKSRVNKFKLSKFRSVIVNSQFTKSYIDQEYGVNSRVIYPPVQTKLFKAVKKEKIILSVGRFSQATTNKKQKEMIEIFRVIHEKFKNWKLILAGGALEREMSYVAEVKKAALGLPVEILTNISFKDIQDLYGKSAIYWQATGFGQKGIDPAAEEHFGISVVEAMAAGSVPLVFNGGGLPEIVTNGKNGFLWNTSAELISQTENLIGSVPLRTKLSNSAETRAKKFDEKVFFESFDDLLNELKK